MDLGFGYKQSISFEGDSGWKHLRMWELNLSRVKIVSLLNNLNSCFIKMLF